MIEPVVGLFGILEKSEEGWENSAGQIALAKRQLESAGMEVAVSGEIVGDEASAHEVGRFFAGVDPDLLFAFIITWSFDHLVLNVLAHIDRPVAILSIPGIRTGSLVGAQQLAYLLTEQNREYEAFFGPPDDAATFEPVGSYARAAAVKRRMERGRIVQIGRRCPGMSPAAFDELEITRLFGPQVVTFSYDEIEEIARTMKKSELRAVHDRIRSIDPSTTSSDVDIDYTARMYLTLKRMHGEGEGELIAFSMGGYPQYAGKVCLVNSLLGDDGIVAGCCEGDVNSAIAMYLLQAFSRHPAHFGEMLEIDSAENSVVTSHCGCSASRLAADSGSISIAPVRLFGRGTCIKFPAMSGPATFVNLVGRRGTYRICAIEGEAKVTDMVFEGNPVKFVSNVPMDEVLRTVFEHGFGHHWIMGYAHAVRDIRSFCKLTGLRGVFPEPADRTGMRRNA
jgi:L-arabinose isomerase